MVRQKTLATKRTAPSGSPDKPRKKWKTPAARDLSTLQAAHKAKEVGKQTHLRAPRTRETYGRHVHQAHAWLQSHYAADHVLSTASPDEETAIYRDPGFKDAFERCPNHCSDQALSIYLSCRGFEENCSQSTVDGIRAAFKMHWEEASVLSPFLQCVLADL